MDDASEPIVKERLFGITFTISDVDDAIRLIYRAMDRGSPEVFAFCNMHTLNIARRSKRFADALSRCTVFNDGLGVDIARRTLQGASFPTNLNGTDLTAAVLASLERPISVFLVGGLPGVAAKAALLLACKYPLINVVGTSDGYFKSDYDAELFEKIRSVRPDLILVGMGNPRQEYWSLEAAAEIGSVMMCVGAYIDFAAGRFPRAPGWLRVLRCEWLHRLVLEPRRLAGRYCLGGLSLACAIMMELITTSYKKLIGDKSLTNDGTTASYNSQDLQR